MGHHVPGLATVGGILNADVSGEFLHFGGEFDFQRVQGVGLVENKSDILFRSGPGCHLRLPSGPVVSVGDIGKSVFISADG